MAKSDHALVASLCLMVAGALGIAGCTSSCDQQPPEVVTLAAVGMDPVGPYIADRDGALAFWGKGALQSTVYLDKGPVDVTVRARGPIVDGQPAQLHISIGQRDIGVIDVDSRVLKEYTLTASVEQSGMTTVQVSFDNYLPKPQPIDSRHVLIESVSLRQPQ